MCERNNACINIFHRWTSQASTLTQPSERDSKTLQERVFAGLLKKARRKDKKNKRNESSLQEFNQSERDEAGSASGCVVKITGPGKHVMFALSSGKCLFLAQRETAQKLAGCSLLFKICKGLKMLRPSHAISPRRQRIFYKQASNALKKKAF